MTAAQASPPQADHGRVMTAVSINVGASMVTALVGLGTTGFLARQLSVPDFGRIVLLLTLVTAFAIFEGQRPVVIHRVAAGIGAAGALFHAAARINAAMVAVTLLCLAVGWELGNVGSRERASEIVLGLTVIAFFVAMQYWTFLDAEQHTVFTGVVRSVAWIVLYLCFCAAAWLGLGVVYYALSLLLMHILLTAMLVVRFRSLGLSRKYSRQNWGEPGPDLLAPALNNIVFNTCAVTINVADRAIVGSMLGVRAAGAYSGPSELALRAVGLVRAGVQVILPWAARLSPSHQQRYWLLSVAAILLFTGTGAVVLLLWRDAIAALLLGEKFRSSGDLLGIFGIGIVTATLGYACIIQLNARGDFSTQRKLYAVGAVILIAGAFLGARDGSLLEVSLAFLAARCIDLALLAVLLRECKPRARRWFLVLSALVFLALIAAWELHGLAAVALLVAACIAGYAMREKGELD